MKAGVALILINSTVMLLPTFHPIPFLIYIFAFWNHISQRITTRKNTMQAKETGVGRHAGSLLLFKPIHIYHVDILKYFICIFVMSSFFLPLWKNQVWYNSCLNVMTVALPLQLTPHNKAYKMKGCLELKLITYHYVDLPLNLLTWEILVMLILWIKSTTDIL